MFGLATEITGKERETQVEEPRYKKLELWKEIAKKLHVSTWIISAEVFR